MGLDILVISHTRHITKDTSGEVNGFMAEIASPRDGIRMENNSQVYVTSVLPGTIKGWHTHAKKTGHLSLIIGKARLVLTDGKEFREFMLDDHKDKQLTVQVPPGIKTAIQTLGVGPAYIVNYSYPDWNPDDKEMTTEPIETYPYKWINP